MTYMVAGYNTSSKSEREKYDKDKLVKCVGGLLMFSSFFLFLGSFLSFIFCFYEAEIFLISNILFTLFIVAGVIYLNVTGCAKKKVKK